MRPVLCLTRMHRFSTQAERNLPLAHIFFLTKGLDVLLIKLLSRKKLIEIHAVCRVLILYLGDNPPKNIIRSPLSDSISVSD